MSIDELINSLEANDVTSENLDKIYELADELFKKASREENHKGMMISDYYYALYHYWVNHNLSKANQYIQSSISEASAFNAIKYQSKALTLSAIINVANSNPIDALDELLKAIKLSEDDIKLKAISRNIFGDIFAQVDDYTTANMYYYDAKNVFESSNFSIDLPYHKALMDYILNAISLKRYDVLDSSINLGLMKFNGQKIVLCYKTLKDIIALYKKLSYIERSIVDDIYHLFIEIEDIDNIYAKTRILMSLYRMVDKTEDYHLFTDYIDLLDSYSLELNDSTVNNSILEIKYKLLGFDESNANYIYNLTDINKNIKDSLRKSIKKIISLHEASIERDDEIEKNKKLTELSSIDELTKLYNRRYGIQQIEQALKDPTKASYAFIMLDIDNFKGINDTYGHQIGDDALVFVAKTLQEMFDKDSIVTRLAGDEFVVLLYNLPTQVDIRKSVVVYKLDLLIKYLEETKLEFLNNQNMSLSMGIDVVDGDFDVLYNNADEALYESKNAGKGKYSIYTPKEEE